MSTEEPERGGRIGWIVPFDELKVASHGSMTFEGPSGPNSSNISAMSVSVPLPNSSSYALIGL